MPSDFPCSQTHIQNTQRVLLGSGYAAQNYILACRRIIYVLNTVQKEADWHALEQWHTLNLVAAEVSGPIQWAH